MAAYTYTAGFQGGVILVTVIGSETAQKRTTGFMVMKRVMSRGARLYLFGERARSLD